jgi:hypothetical protein
MFLLRIHTSLSESSCYHTCIASPTASNDSYFAKDVTSLKLCFFVRLNSIIEDYFAAAGQNQVSIAAAGGILGNDPTSQLSRLISSSANKLPIHLFEKRWLSHSMR